MFFRERNKFTTQYFLCSIEVDSFRTSQEFILHKIDQNGVTMPFCKHCGKLNREEATVCNRCGKKLSGKASSENLKLEIRDSNPCGVCNGTGKNYRRRKCEICNGTGTIYLVDCPDCNAQGTVESGKVCSTCNGNKIISSIDAQSFLDARNSCSTLQDNPLKALIVPIICFVVIAISARFLWSYLFVDFFLISTFGGYISIIVLLGAFAIIFKRCTHYFRGSKNDSNKESLEATGIAIVSIGFLAAIIGPITTDGYDWIEGEAKSTINKKILKTEPVKCTSVNISRNDHDTYFGNAKLSDGSVQEIVVTYKNEGSTGSGKHRRIKYRITVDFQ